MADTGISRRATIEVPINADVSKLASANENLDKLIGQADKLKSAFSSSNFKSATDTLDKLDKQMGSLSKSTGGVSKSFDNSNRAFDKYASSISKVSSSTKEALDNTEVFSKYKDAVVDNLDATKKAFNGAGNASKHFAEKVTKATQDATDNQENLRRMADGYGGVAEKLNGSTDKIARANEQLSRSGKLINQQHVAPRTTGVDTYSSSIKRATDMSEKFSHAGWSMLGVTAGLGASFLNGAKNAAAMQQSYNYITNLAVTSGEKRAAVLKNVAAMQKENTDLSVKYGISQTELAKGDEQLVHAGYSTNAALAAHKVLVQGAIATNQSYGDVMDNVTSIIDQYGLRTNNVNKMSANTSKIMNEMAYSVDHSKSSFNDFGEAMKYVGSTSHSTNQQLSGTMSALAVLSKNGQDGSEAGTGLRKVLDSFGAAGKGMGGGGQKAVMQQLGLSDKDFHDAKGNLLQLGDLMKLMRDRMEQKGLNKGQIFSDMHQFFGTTGQETALILEKNANAIGDLNNQVERSDKMKGGGYVQWLSGKNMQTATNQINVFKQAWNAFGIATANTILPTLTGAVKGLDKVLLAVNHLSPTGKSIVAWGAIVVAAISPVMFVLGSLHKALNLLTFGALDKLIQRFKTPLDDRLTGSINESTQQIANDANRDVNSGEKIDSSAQDIQAARSVDTDSVSMSRSEYRSASKMARFKSRFGGIRTTGTRFGQVADDAHLLGNAGKDVGYVSEHAGGMTRGAKYLAGFAGMGTLAKLSASKAGGLLTSGLSKLRSSKLLTGAKAIGSKIPFLDLAMAGTNLIGINHKNAGNKLGSTGGMAAGTMAGGALGTLLDPFTFGMGTLGGAALGGWLGQKGGGALGSKIQKIIPKHPFQSIEKGWDSLTKKIGHSSFGKAVSNMFGSIKKYAADNFKPVGKAWDGMTKEASKAWHSVSSMFSGAGSSISKAFKPASQAIGGFMKALHTTKTGKAILKGLGVAFKVSLLPIKGILDTVSITFKVSMSLIKAAAKGAITFLKDGFTGLFKTIGGIFKVGTDLMTGKWKNLGSDLKSIGNGITQIMKAPFDAAWTAIKSIFGDIEHAAEGVWNSIKGMGSKVGNILKHPIKSVEHMFANGSQAQYPNGLPKDTNAVVNDGTGPELIQFGDNLGMFKGKNVHTMLPKGSRVYNAQQTKSMVGVQYFANGTEQNQPINMTAMKATFDNSKNARKFRSDNQKHLKNINSDTKKSNDALSDQSTKQFSDMYTALGKLTDTMHSTLISKMKSFEQDWQKVLDLLPKDAQASMQSVINALNKGISGIDSSLQQFGGNESVLKPFHYAAGSDGQLPTDQIAMVNDAKVGPKQEAIVRDGSVFLPKYHDQIMHLRKGDQVLNGKQTERLIKNQTINHYAKGSGVSDSTLVSIAGKYAKNPDSAYQAEFNSKLKPEGPNLEHGLTGAIANAIKPIGQKWSGAMWSLINSTINGSGGGSAPLLNAVRKYGTGHKYVWGADGPDTFDCSGLIKYAAEKAFGVSLPHFSGAIMNDTSPVSRGSIQAGDLVGNNDHIGVVVDKDHYFSAFNPSSKPNILETPLNSTYFPGTPKFGRLKGVPSGSSNSKKDQGSMLDKLVKGELGQSALKWIKDKLVPLGASGGAAGDSPLPSGSHTHWLQQAGISAKDFSAANYIISHESGWNPHATNPNGGAYGLPQSLPGDKMASAGSDWRNNPITQLKWMKSYVDGKYGGFQGAQAYWEKNHNYANGGWSNRPATFGEVPGEPEVAINPKRPSADRLINEAIAARAKATGRPLQNFLQQKQLRAKGKAITDKLAALFTKRDKRPSKPQVVLNPTFNFNVTGNMDESQARKFARIAMQEMQRAAYNSMNKMGYNEV